MLNMIPNRQRKELDRLKDEMDKLFDRFFDFRPFSLSPRESEWMPLVDISENPEEIVIHVEIPGMDSDDIDLSLDGRTLTLRGEKKAVHKDRDEHLHRMERSYGAFARSIELPSDVDSSKVTASYKNGVLKISLPKSEEPSVKKVEVKRL